LDRREQRKNRKEGEGRREKRKEKGKSGRRERKRREKELGSLLFSLFGYKGRRRTENERKEEKGPPNE
jgi:hypothetical protein